MNLVIGKFYPLHRGHQYVIEQALADGPTLIVLMWSERETWLPWTVRWHWLIKLYPAALVIAVRDELPTDFDDPAVSRQHAALIHERWSLDNGAAITKVFGSEVYIDHLADYFGAEAVMVDRPRETYPISASQIREDVARHWAWLPPSVQHDLCRRVVCIGAESTGTTTLARDLAAHYHTVWVPEYGRLYSEGVQGHTWLHEDLRHIWEVQGCLEHMLATRTRAGLLICDTNQLATRVWEEFLIGSSELVCHTRADLYLLTDLLPWEADGLRDGQHFRDQMQDRFREILNESDVTWALVSGTRAERRDQAVELINSSTSVRV